MTYARSARPSVFAVFANRSFSLLWTGQLISGLGSALTTLASSLLVYRITGSALSVGLMLIATAGPTILSGLVAGVFVDRYDRKTILVTSDVLRCILIFLVPILVPLGIGWLYVLVALSSAITQFFDSAQASVLPELASDEDLAAANSLMTISANLATMVGFAAAGVIAGINIDLAFYLNAASFALSALLMLVTHIPGSPAIEDTSLRAIAVNLQAGFKTVRDTPVLRSMFLIFAPVFLLFGLEYALWLPFSLKVLGGTDFEFGILESVDAIGLVVGSAMMVGFADRIREGQWLALSFISIAVAGVAYALSPTMAVSILMVGIAGFVNAPSLIGRQLVIQRYTPPAMRGRVNSGLFVVRDSMFVVGMLLAGLGDVVDVRILYFGSALLLLVVGAASLVLPGLSQPPAQWRRLLDLLRGIEAAPRLGAGVAASSAEISKFIAHRPELAKISSKEREELAAQTLVVTAPAGKIVVYRGETSDAAYFILKGSVGVGYIKDEEYIILNYLNEGDFFGEVAALTGAARTANVITEEDSEFLIIPAKVMRRLAERYDDLRQLFFTTIAQRLSATEIPLGTLLDQNMLRELRTNAPASEK